MHYYGNRRYGFSYARRQMQFGKLFRSTSLCHSSSRPDCSHLAPQLRTTYIDFLTRNAAPCRRSGKHAQNVLCDGRNATAICHVVDALNVVSLTDAHESGQKKGMILGSIESIQDLTVRMNSHRHPHLQEMGTSLAVLCLLRNSLTTSSIRL